MDTIVFHLGTAPMAVWKILAAACGIGVFLLVLACVAVVWTSRRRTFERAAAARRQRELDDKIAVLADLSARHDGRMQAMAELLGARQGDLARLMAERLDAVGQRVGDGLANSTKETGDSLARLNERLAVIDAAQAGLAGLTLQVTGLKEILGDKQRRGAFGQGRMEAIVRDGLPAGAFAFQVTLSNGCRPDCLIHLPGDTRGLVIDAKFPLEAFTALKDASGDAERQKAESRIRSDVGRHVKDIVERYFLPGETQDLAILFVPSDSLHAELNEHFEDVIQKAHRARIIILSPSLLMMAIQVMQTIVRDQRMLEQAGVIQLEVRRLLDDVRRLRERAVKLELHFRQAQDDIAGIVVSAGKVGKRADRIDALEYSESPAVAMSTAAE